MSLRKSVQLICDHDGCGTEVFQDDLRGWGKSSGSTEMLYQALLRLGWRLGVARGDGRLLDLCPNHA